MPRSRNDPFKRKCAQALNHMAAAILDVNDVYNAFEENRVKLVTIVEADNKALAEAQQVSDATFEQLQNDLHVMDNIHNAERYAKYCEDLKVIMMGIHACREHLILFTTQIWGLDEESIRVYMG